MKTRWWQVATVPIFLSVLLFAGFKVAISAYAQNLTTNCSGTCLSDLIWDGSQHGMEAYLTTSAPTTGDYYSYWQRLISLDNGGIGGMWAGIEYDGEGQAQGELCPTIMQNHWVAKTLYYVFEYENSSGYIADGGCAKVNTNEYNTVHLWKMGYFASNGGGMYVQTDADNSTFCNSCFIGGAPQTWYYSSFLEDIHDHVNEHEVWGSYQQEFYYQNIGSGNWDAQSRLPDTFVVNSPPQMFWVVKPGGSPAGGQLETCIYDSTSNTCEFGA